nr:MATE family efflux transporter [Streptococcus macacae]
MKQIKEILNIALPAMAENFLQMLMGIVDNYLVAQLGILAISGVSVANNIITVYQAIFIALGAAVTSVVSKSFGEKDASALKNHARQAISVTIILSLVLGLFSLICGNKILTLLGTETKVSAIGGLYLAIVGGGIVSLGLMTTLGSLLRAIGKVRFPMYVSLLSNFLNAVLSALAVFVLGWGVLGVASATVISRLLGTVILMKRLELKPHHFLPQFQIDKDLIQIAFPAALERLMMRAGDIVIIAIIVKFGTKIVAGNAIGEVLTQFNYMPGFGVATASVMLTAYYFGQGNPAEIKKSVQSTYYISVLLMGLVSCSAFLLGHPLGSLFTADKNVLAASQTVLLFSFLGTPVSAGTLIYTAAWQGLGKARLPFYATTIGMWLIRIVLGYFLAVHFHLSLAGVWLATLADNAFRHLFLYSLYKRYLNDLFSTASSREDEKN